MLVRALIKSLKLREDAMHANDGCRPLLLACNSQGAFGVLKSRLVERHKGIHDVAFRVTAFHGRGSASGVRHRRLVDVAWRLFLGRLADLDGLIVRSRSSSVDEVIRRTREATMALQNAATGTSVRAELALVGTAAHAMAQRLFAAITRRVQDVFDSYRPELHYMRGPGPRWREKHGMTARNGWGRESTTS
jgi:hypothetical protein